jgi:hypothetical protein
LTCKIVSEKFLTLIILTSITATLLSVGAEFLLQDVQAQVVYIQSKTPADGARNVPPNSKIEVKFSGEVVQSSVTTSTFMVKGSTGDIVGGSVGTIRDHRTNPITYGAYFTPSSPLKRGETYTVTIDGIVGAKVLQFQQKIKSTWSFTVSQDSTIPTVSYVSPPNGAEGVAGNALIVVQFSEPVTRSSLTAATFTLKDSANNNIAGRVILPSSTFIFPRPVTSATFDPIPTLLEGQAYTATIRGFTDASTNMGAPKSWSFTVGSGETTNPPLGRDTTPPTVVAVSPADSTSGVPTYITIKAAFSEPIARSSLTTSTFIVKDSTTGNLVSGTILLPSGPNITAAGYDPLSPLADGRKYSVELTNGIKDMARNSLTPKSWSFSTGPPQSADTTALKVIAFQPSDGAKKVASNILIAVKFNKLVDASTLSTSTFKVRDNVGKEVAGKVYTQQAGSSSIAVFDPSSVLKNKIKYRVDITDGIKDMARNSLTPKSWSFTTK